MYRWTMVLLAAAGIVCSTAGLCLTLSTLPTPLLWGVTVDGYPVTPNTLELLEQEMSYRFNIVVFFLQWPKPGSDGPFPCDSLDAIWKREALPCITWEPFYIAEGKETAVTREEILGGTYDRYLNAFADAAVRWRKPFIIRLAHEMNLKRYHWGGPPEVYGPESPAVYQAIFRYVKGLFDRVGATNVIWAFCPNAESIPNPHFAPFAPWNRAGFYYPGHDAVDILGMDGYNWGTTQTYEKNGWQSHWRSFREIFTSLYDELSAIAPEKPIMVFETASTDQGGIRAQWVTDMADTARAWGLLGLSWFQAEKETDWRLKALDSAPGFTGGGVAADAGQQWAWRFIKKRTLNR